MSALHELSAPHPHPDPSTHATSRTQIRALIVQIISQFLRTSILHQERNRIIRTFAAVGMTPRIDPAYLSKRVALQFEARLPNLRKQSYLYDRILYLKANTMEEYYDLETLPRRVEKVGGMLAQRARAAGQIPRNLAGAD